MGESPWATFLYKVLFIFGTLKYIIRDKLHPAISVEFFNAPFGNLAFLLIILGLINHYGALSFSEFLPRGKDYVILAVGLFIKIWAVGLLVGGEEIKADPER
jgi:hypothetical protein